MANRLASAKAAYAAGEDAAIEQFASELGTNAGELEPLLTTNDAWHSGDAAVLLEIAVAVRHFRVVERALTVGRMMVMSRDRPLGADALEDRFEVLWHSAAIGVAQAHPTWSVQQTYLAAVAPRFQGALRRGIDVPTRIPLAMAMSAEIACCYHTGAGRPVRRVKASERDWPIEKSLDLYRQAAEHPPLAVESMVRSSGLLFAAERFDEARQLLDRIPAHSDCAVGYIQHLTAARVHDRSNRPDEAAAAYRRALGCHSQSQHANLGLSAALLRLGLAQQATAAVAVALQDKPDDRYFREFHRLDAARVRGWLIELRGLRQ